MKYKQIWINSDGNYCFQSDNKLFHPFGAPYCVGTTDIEKKAEVEAYLLDHPEALIPEPVPPEPTQEELDRREEQSLLAYLASTDWYAVRYAEISVPVPDDVASKRDEARVMISELRGKA